MITRRNNSIYIATIFAFAVIFNISCEKNDDKDLIINGEGVIGIDGDQYDSVIIGEQEWLVENLKTTKYNDGEEILNITDNNDWAELNTGAYAVYENNSQEYQAKYGLLYNWYAVNTLKLCPTGWRVPTNEDWNILIDYLGGVNIAGGKLKAKAGWHNNGNGNDVYGFGALPAGQRHSNGSFFSIEEYAYWWSNSFNDDINPIGRWMPFGDNSIGSGSLGGDKRQGLSIRCIRDKE